VAKRLPSQNSKPLSVGPQDSPDSGATGNVVMGLSQPVAGSAEVDPIHSLHRPDG
jgi:hypothetical protein